MIYYDVHNFCGLDESELDKIRLASKAKRLEKSQRYIFLALLKGYTIPAEYANFVGRYNVGSPVFYDADDDYVYFLTKDVTLARMPIRYARHFNWHYPFPSMNLVDIAEDLHRPFCSEIMY